MNATCRGLYHDDRAPTSCQYMGQFRLYKIMAWCTFGDCKTTYESWLILFHWNFKQNAVVLLVKYVQKHKQTPTTTETQGRYKPIRPCSPHMQYMHGFMIMFTIFVHLHYCRHAIKRKREKCSVVMTDKHRHNQISSQTLLSVHIVPTDTLIIIMGSNSSNNYGWR